MHRSFVLKCALVSVVALASACGGRAFEDVGALPENGASPDDADPTRPSSNVSPPREAPAGMPSPGSPSQPSTGGSSPVGATPPVGAPPTETPRPDAPRQEPISEPYPPECARGVVIDAFDQLMIDELEGCEVLPDGLRMVGGLDLRPLHALREVGGEGLSIADGFDLRGLENLQRTTKLIVSRFGIVSFRELVSLSDVQWLEVHYSRLIDFQGLENVSGITGLALYGNDALVSLSGLSLSPELSTLILDTNQYLSRIEELRTVSAILGELRITRTALESLDPLENVFSSVEVVDISANPFLRDIQALGAVQSMGAFYVMENPSLETAPNFERLSHLGTLLITNNAALQTPPAFPSLGSIASSLEVTSNPQLGSLAFPALYNATTIVIGDNESLADVTFGNLVLANQLMIYNNQPLDGASVAASLSGVQSEFVRIPSDQTVSSFSPCPWTLDDFCDETFLCAPGTDPVCAQ